VFEVVSVRPSPPVFNAPAGTRDGVRVLSGGRFEARGQTLAQLAGVAFGFENADPARGMVEAKVEWFSTDRFDITATAAHRWTTPPPGATLPAELRTMLRALLEERFGLKTRIQQRTVDVTALRLAKPRVPNVDGLRPSKADCHGLNVNAPPGEPLSRRCTVTLTRERLLAEGVTMTETAQLITRIQELWPLSLPVVDQTRLPGRYDLSLSLPTVVVTSDSGLRGGEFFAGLSPRVVAITKAMEAQLGLTLEPARVPIPILIIEGARKPKED
jgi:uncharacterized protein (TIGR03435 family)